MRSHDEEDDSLRGFLRENRPIPLEPRADESELIWARIESSSHRPALRKAAIWMALPAAAAAWLLILATETTPKRGERPLPGLATSHAPELAMPELTMIDESMRLALSQDDDPHGIYEVSALASLAE